MKFSIPRFLLSFLLLAGAAGGLVTACGRIQAGQAGDAAVTVDMAVQPEQPSVGESVLVFTLTDEQGQPIDDATLEIEGNMTHAGMVPVVAQVAGGEKGRYTVPFKWTMGGDWLVTVKVTLADGRVFSREFPVSVE